MDFTKHTIFIVIFIAFATTQALTPHQQLTLLAESLSFLPQVPTLPDFNEWEATINALPYNRQGANPCKNSGLNWNQLDQTLDNFFAVMTKQYQKPALWLNKAPTPTDAFFDPKHELLFKPFVQKLVVNPNTTIALRGDLHGDVHSLIAYIKYLQKQGYMDANDAFKISQTHADDFYMIFLGDYVDRGNYGSEVLYTIMRLKIANPSQVILVRGNHEDVNISSSYGFAMEAMQKFPDEKKAYTKI